MSRRAVPEAPARPQLPRRDADGRMVSLPEVLGAAVLFTLVNGVGLIAVDGLLSLLGLGRFGRSSGWLVLILPAMLFFDDFRAWREHRLRWLVAPVAALAGLAVGLLVLGLAPSLPPLASGAIGGLLAVLVYPPVWFLGIRYLTRSERS